MPKRAPSSSSGNFVPGGNACSMIAWRNALQAKSTRVDFLLIRNLAAGCRLAKLGGYFAYDNPAFRTHDAAILVEPLELAAAHRPNFMLRISLKSGNNREYAQPSHCLPTLRKLRGKHGNRDRASNPVYRI